MPQKFTNGLVRVSLYMNTKIQSKRRAIQTRKQRNQLVAFGKCRFRKSLVFHINGPINRLKAQLNYSFLAKITHAYISQHGFSMKTEESAMTV